MGVFVDNLFSYSMASVLAGALMAVTPIAMASEGSEAKSQRVHLADLDVKTADGQRRANARIARAVKDVCPDRYERNLRRQSRARDCQNVAKGSAAEAMADYRQYHLQSDKLLAERTDGLR